PAGVSCPCDVMPLTIIDESHLLLRVEGKTGESQPVPSGIVSTSDGGQTWEVLPGRPGANFALNDAYADPSHWFLVLAQPGWNKTLPTRDWLYATSDGGHSWTLVQKYIPLGFPVAYLAFFDADHWIAIQPQNATQGE